MEMAVIAEKILSLLATRFFNLFVLDIFGNCVLIALVSVKKIIFIQNRNFSVYPIRTKETV